MLPLTCPYIGTTIMAAGKMAYVRTKRRGQRLYYYLVESKREGKKVRQKVIKYLGTELPTKEQIEAMRRER